MTILCNRTRSNFLNCKTMENQKLKFSLAHSLANRTSHLVKLSLPDIYIIVYMLYIIVFKCKHKTFSFELS